MMTQKREADKSCPKNNLQSGDHTFSCTSSILTPLYRSYIADKSMRMNPRMRRVTASWIYQGMGASMKTRMSVQMMMPAKISPPRVIKANPILLSRFM